MDNGSIEVRPAPMLLPGPAARRSRDAIAAVRSLPAAWLVLSATGVVELIWALRVDLAVSGWVWTACVALGLAALAAACRRFGRWATVGSTIDAIGVWLAFTAAGCLLTYLAARCDLPLQDAAFERLDRAMGFDWMAWSNWVAAHPAVDAVLACAYQSLPLQILFCCCLLPLTGEPRRLAELFWGAYVAILVTALVSALLPAIGAFPYYGLLDKADWLPDLLALRRPGPTTFTLDAMKGIITMPSYHAVLAWLFIYANRRTGVVGIAVTALNLAMIVSIPDQGGHYVCDVLAGSLLAAVAIAAVRWPARSRRHPRCARQHPRTRRPRAGEPVEQ